MAKRKTGRNKKGSSFRISDYIDPLYIRVFIGLVIVMSLVSSTLIIVGQVKTNRAMEEEAREMQAFQTGINQALNLLSLSDFVFPEQFARERNQIYLQREPHTYWTEEEVERYWIPIEDTGLEDITEENRNLLKDLLKGNR